ncbi:MAG: hypothetical protein WD059_08180 [Balneolaceae bacterium]
MKKVISILFFLLVGISRGNAQDLKWGENSSINWEKLSETTNATYNTYGMWLLGEDSLLFEDLAIHETPLLLFDVDRDTAINLIQTGRGPGEVHPTFYKRTTKFSNGNILLWDSGHQRASIYDRNLKYQNTLSGDVFNQRIYQVGLINDSTLFVSGSKKARFEIVRLKRFIVDEANIINTIDFDDYGELQGLNNFMHRQAIYLANDGDRIYLSFEFSSVIMGISEKGIEFKTSLPGNLTLPDFHENSPTYSLPKMGEHPECSRYIAVNNRFVFSLFNGENISKWQQIRYASNFDFLIDKAKHTKNLLIYDKRDGSFINEIELPIESKFLAVSGDNIFYFINSLNDKTVLFKYLLTN